MYFITNRMLINIYTEIGPERLRLLVSYFYKEVFSDQIIGPLFKNSNQQVIEEKQFMFLSQFFGGPNLYTESFGHPKMRMRHLAHPITQEAKNAWLHCMKKAIHLQDFDEILKTKLYQSFLKIAEHMVNC